jgi:hypothetical protein
LSSTTLANATALLGWQTPTVSSPSPGRSRRVEAAVRQVFVGGRRDRDQVWRTKHRNGCLREAVAFYAHLSVNVERVMTDNGTGYRRIRLSGG